MFLISFLKILLLEVSVLFFSEILLLSLVKDYYLNFFILLWFKFKPDFVREITLVPAPLSVFVLLAVLIVVSPTLATYF